MSDMPLCKCGCGTQVERKTKKYFGDHYRNPPMGVNPETVKKKKPIVPVVPELEEKVKKPIVPVVPELEEKVKKTEKIKKAKKPIVPIKKKAKKAPLKIRTRSIPGGKISKANLKNMGLGIYT
jgi:hypothetical protein